jgi:hypothetical protein
VNSYEFPKCREEDLGFCVSGGRPLGKVRDITDLVSSALIHEDGQVWPNGSASSSKFYQQILRKIGEAYLDGRWNLADPILINSECCILPVDRDMLNKVIEEVGNLDDLTFEGKVKQPLESIEPEERTAEEHALQYLRDLVLWKVDSTKYVGRLKFTITEHEKQTKEGTKTSFVIEKQWKNVKKVKPGQTGYSENKGKERIVISGYQKK